MEDRYALIKSRLMELAESDDSIKAVIAIGSTTRKDIVADEFSDLDLFIITDDAESWLRGKNPEKLGNVRISFVEPTLGGGEERRCIFEDSLDVDMIVLTPERFDAVVKEGIASWVCNRGYKVLYDTMGFEKLMAQYIKCEVGSADISEAEYKNRINDFYFHIIWASKKILRGEFWSGKMCLDAYLKGHLLRIMEAYTTCKYHTDTWHDGRFLDRWADSETKNELKNCFAHYERDDMVSALKATFKLFTRLAGELADMKGYPFPEDAKKCAETFLEERF